MRNSNNKQFKKTITWIVLNAEFSPLINKINSPERRAQALKVALEKYDLKKAMNKYHDLYYKLLPLKNKESDK